MAKSFINIIGKTYLRRESSIKHTVTLSVGRGQRHCVHAQSDYIFEWGCVSANFKGEYYTAKGEPPARGTRGDAGDAKDAFFRFLKRKQFR